MFEALCVAQPETKICLEVCLYLLMFVRLEFFTSSKICIAASVDLQ